MKEVKIVDCCTLTKDDKLFNITVKRLTNADGETCATYGIKRKGFKKDDISTNIYEVAKFVDELNEANGNIDNNIIIDLIEHKFFN